MSKRSFYIVNENALIVLQVELPSLAVLLTGRQLHLIVLMQLCADVMQRD